MARTRMEQTRVRAAREFLHSTAVTSAVAVLAFLIFTQQLLAQSPPGASAPTASSAPADVQAPSAPASSVALAFDVVSIKPQHSVSPGTNIDISFHNDSLTASGVTVKDLIKIAYKINDHQLSGGPSWAESEKYVVQAKIDEATIEMLAKLPREQQAGARRGMVQSLLAERFKLKVSHSTRQLPIYALVLTKKEPKFSPSSAANGVNTGIGSHNGQLTVTGTDMSHFADWLSSIVGRNVIDKTGLQGKYDFTMHWSRESLLATAGAGAESGKAAVVDDSSGPSIFTALQEQLGLKLESQKGPVDTLIIDSVEKPAED
jgi:uncharacterized protein (TIGR03435 family)